MIHPKPVFTRNIRRAGEQRFFYICVYFKGKEIHVPSHFHPGLVTILKKTI
jgi:hypothetical protein